jgi:anti-sigma factor RsiW
MSGCENEHIHEAGESCKQLLSTLGEYVDGALSEELCSELERHMKDCERCRIVVDTLKKTIDLYQELEDDNGLPAEVRQRLYMRLNLEDYQKENVHQDARQNAGQ